MRIIYGTICNVPSKIVNRLTHSSYDENRRKRHDSAIRISWRIGGRAQLQYAYDKKVDIDETTKLRKEHKR